jgi:hypothetical protein
MKILTGAIENFVWDTFLYKDGPTILDRLGPTYCTILNEKFE